MARKPPLSALMIASLSGKLIDYFAYGFDAAPVVHVRNRSLGVLRLILNAGVLAYIVVLITLFRKFAVSEARFFVRMFLSIIFRLLWPLRFGSYFGPDQRISVDPEYGIIEMRCPPVQSRCTVSTVALLAFQSYCSTTIFIFPFRSLPGTFGDCTNVARQATHRLCAQHDV